MVPGLFRRRVLRQQGELSHEGAPPLMREGHRVGGTMRFGCRLFVVVAIVISVILTVNGSVAIDGQHGDATTRTTGLSKEPFA